MSDYTFTLDLRVYDKTELYQAAFNHAMSVDKMSADDARETLTMNGNEINVHACLGMLLDPGSMPGSTIYGHEVENTDMYCEEEPL